MQIINTIKLELTRHVGQDGLKNPVLTIYIDEQMIQRTGPDAGEIYYTIKEILEPGEHIIFEEDEDGK